MRGVSVSEKRTKVQDDQGKQRLAKDINRGVTTVGVNGEVADWKHGTTY
jgi:hypothetical protein